MCPKKPEAPTKKIQQMSGCIHLLSASLQEGYPTKFQPLNTDPFNVYWEPSLLSGTVKIYPTHARRRRISSPTAQG